MAWIVLLLLIVCFISLFAAEIHVRACLSLMAGDLDQPPPKGVLAYRKKIGWIKGHRGVMTTEAANHAGKAIIFDRIQQVLAVSTVVLAVIAGLSGCSACASYV